MKTLLYICTFISILGKSQITELNSISLIDSLSTTSPKIIIDFNVSKNTHLVIKNAIFMPFSKEEALKEAMQDYDTTSKLLIYGLNSAQMSKVILILKKEGFRHISYFLGELNLLQNSKFIETQFANLTQTSIVN